MDPSIRGKSTFFVSKFDPKKISVLIALRDFQHVGDLGRPINTSEIWVSSGSMDDSQHGSRSSANEACDSLVQLAAQSALSACLLHGYVALRGGK